MNLYASSSHTRWEGKLPQGVQEFVVRKIWPCSDAEFTWGVHAVQVQTRPTTCGLGHHQHFGVGKQYKGEQAPQ
jgi:hypothetical protein